MPIVPINSQQSPGENGTRPARSACELAPRPNLNLNLSLNRLGMSRPQASLKYTVGYRKPPKHTQFKAGQSVIRKPPQGGKGPQLPCARNADAEGRRSKADGEKRISRIQAVLQKTVELAMKGTPRALAELIKLYANAVPMRSPLLADMKNARKS
jgi:hypothetical protein